MANEEVVDGKSEVGGFPVVRRPMRQWMLRITAYAERLLTELNGLDWPEGVKLLQRNWIGKSEGAEIDFKIDESDQKIRVFTTRPDTLYGGTFLVLAPEHSLVDFIVTEEQWPAVREYRERTARKSDLERADLSKDKTGVFTGAFTSPIRGASLATSWVVRCRRFYSSSSEARCWNEFSLWITNRSQMDESNYIHLHAGCQSV